LYQTTTNAADPVYLYLDLIAQAEKYLEASQAAAELKAKQEAELKAAAELKAKQEAEEAAVKAATELKAKLEAEAIAAAELKAKQEADAKAAASKKSTVICVKGKVVKRITGTKPKCPSGFKLKK
jgi:membrane protein involved in colicin uptake